MKFSTTLLLLFPILSLVSCQESVSDEKVMTSTSAFEAELQNIERQVKGIDNSNNIQHHTFSREVIDSISTENPYWSQMTLSFDDVGLKKVLLRDEDGVEEEQFYFGNENRLIYAFKLANGSEKEEYYFFHEKLVRASKSTDSTFNVLSSGVKFTSIELVTEAALFREFASNKNLLH